MARLAGHGIDAEVCLVPLDGIDDIEERITEALRAREWEGVVVGGGIRKSEELLELFESVVNLVRRHSPGAEIVFSNAPEDILDAVGRRVPPRPD